MADQKEKISKAKKVAADRGYELIDATQLNPIEFIATGLEELDRVIKGFPRGRIVEVYGPSGNGKSSLLLATIGHMSSKLKVLYIDVENALDPLWISHFDIKPNQMMLANPLVLEDAAELMLEQIGKFDLIVFDSVAAALFKSEQTSEVGDYHIGVKPRIMTSFMRRLVGPLAKSKTSVVFINQEKPTIGDMYAPKFYTPGGKALEYAASMRIRLTSNKADRIIVKGTKIGKTVKAELTKNKVGTPDREATFQIFYEGESSNIENENAGDMK